MFRRIINYFIPIDNNEVKEINLSDKYIHSIQEIKKLYDNENINIDLREKFLKRKPYASNVIIEYDITLFGWSGTIIETSEDYHFAGATIYDYLHAKCLDPSCKIVFDQELENDYQKCLK